MVSNKYKRFLKKIKDSDCISDHTTVRAFIFASRKGLDRKWAIPAKSTDEKYTDHDIMLFVGKALMNKPDTVFLCEVFIDGEDVSNGFLKASDLTKQLKDEINERFGGKTTTKKTAGKPKKTTTKKSTSSGKIAKTVIYYGSDGFTYKRFRYGGGYVWAKVKDGVAERWYAIFDEKRKGFIADLPIAAYPFKTAAASVKTLREYAKKEGITISLTETKKTAAKPKRKAAAKKTTRKPAKTQKRLNLKNHSESRDRAFKALAPGKRTSKSGRIYYEYRPEHSDTEEERKTHGIKTPPQLRYAIKPSEDFARPFEYEWFHGADKYGKIVYKKTDHDKGSVWVGDMPDNLPCVTHNHPNSSSFSHADICTAIRMGCAEIRVASREYDYYVRLHPESWKQKGFDSQEDYGMAMYREYQMVDLDLLDKYQPIVDKAWKKECEKKPELKNYTDRQISNSPEWKKVTHKPHCEQTHETMLILSKKYGWEYRRIRKRNRRK